MKPKSSWTNLGSNPLVVLLGVLASIITIIGFLSGKFELKALFPISGTPSTVPSTNFSSSIDSTAHVEAATIPVSPTYAAMKFSTSSTDGMVLVYVPAGRFPMGADNGGLNEQPVHSVYLSAYWIDQTPVTDAMYMKCVQAKMCDPLPWLSSYLQSIDEEYPVTGVDWSEAQAYCRWAGRSLPTEAEWEKAGRGVDGRLYPWGNNPPNLDLAPIDKGGISKVGRYQRGASPYGVLDMVGLVWQWVADWYDGTYYMRSPQSNPRGPESGQSRVYRGVNWNFGEINLTTRNWSSPNIGGDKGIRCASSQP